MDVAEGAANGVVGASHGLGHRSGGEGMKLVQPRVRLGELAVEELAERVGGVVGHGNGAGTTPASETAPLAGPAVESPGSPGADQRVERST